MVVPAVEDESVPLISILLPSRNRLELLKHAVNSVLGQAFRSFEIVISDNCSEEDYAGYVALLDEPRVRLVRLNAPVPVTQNWNNALDHATGRYVIMLGDDDALVPGSLARLSELVHAHQQPDVVYAMAYHYAYPGVIPSAAGGYFATVKPRPIFSGQQTPTFLEPARGRFFAAQALRFPASFRFQQSVFRVEEGIHRAGQPTWCFLPIAVSRFLFFVCDSSEGGTDSRRSGTQSHYRNLSEVVRLLPNQ